MLFKSKKHIMHIKIYLNNGDIKKVQVKFDNIQEEVKIDRIIADYEA